jgi:hypothetical protein
MVVQRPLDLINLKRQHLKRLANQNGAAGEAEVLAANVHYVARPKGPALDTLMAALKESGVVVKRSSFDAIALPEGVVVDFTDREAVKTHLRSMVFVASQQGDRGDAADLRARNPRPRSIDQLAGVCPAIGLPRPAGPRVPQHHPPQRPESEADPILH